MILPSGRTATPAGLRRNTRLASIGTGGWFASEWVAGFVGIRNEDQALRVNVGTISQPLRAVVSQGVV
jgi:hypothetical protein